MKIRYLVSCAAAAVLSSTAHAAPAAPAADAATAATPAADATPAVADDQPDTAPDTNGEIIVTAQRRNESI